MSDTGGVRWYRHGGDRLAAAIIISCPGLFPVGLIIHGIGHPVRWALIVPGAVLAAAVAMLSCLPMRAGIGVTPEHILIRTFAGRTRTVPWAQVTGFEAGMVGPRSRGKDAVFVLTSGGKRWQTSGYRASGTSPTETWRLLRALEDERLARAPGAASTLPPPPPPPPGPGEDRAVASAWTGMGVIALILFGTLPLYQVVTGLGPALRAASSDGTAGYFIPQRETTGRGATWYGEFRLPDGTVTRRDVSIEDLSVDAMQGGVPVAARDTGDSGVVFPRDDPGAWHRPADSIAMGTWFYGWAFVIIIRKGIRLLRRGRRHGSPTAPS